MSVGLGIGLAFIAFVQMAVTFAVAYFSLGRWLEGRPRVWLSAGAAAAFWIALVLFQAFQDGWSKLYDPKVQLVLVTYALTLALFTLRSDRESE